MRPFFSYYGAKWQAAKHLGPPRRPLVIEPFAGSACYSTRWDVRTVRLYDVSPQIVSLWDFLIRCSDADIAALPDSFESFDEVAALADGPQTLVRFWIAKGRAEPSGALSPWYFEFRGDSTARVWGPAIKARIRAQKPLIAAWTVTLGGYDAAPNDDAHWHIDPPYNNSAGARYPHSGVNFTHLAQWCMGRRGTVDVCENSGATWLPFVPYCSVVSSRGRRDGTVSNEALFRVDAAQDGRG